MKSIDVTIRYPDGETDPFAVYEIQGWALPAAEIYSIGKNLWLALLNSTSTGFRRRVFRGSRGMHNWIQKGIRGEFPCDVVEFRWDIKGLSEK